MIIEIETTSDSPVNPSNEIDEEFASIKDYSTLSEKQHHLLYAIIEFIKKLKFDIWDDNNHSSWALKTLPTIMELMDKQILAVIVEWYFKDSSEKLKKTARHISTDLEDTSTVDISQVQDQPNRVAFCFTICLLFQIRLLKNNQPNKAVECCDILMGYLKRNSKHLSPLFSAKIFALISRVYTMIEKPHMLIRFWFQMLSIHQLLHFNESYATLVNLIVQLYIRSNLWQQADNFVSKCKFPESTSNSQQARYSYSCGSICMVHREYRNALKHFSKSLTSSQNLNAVGLRQRTVRSMLLSKLLIGEYPDRKLFLNECYFKGILPYFDLIKAVKLGSQHLFTQYIQQNVDCYIGDKTAAVVFRLHHNVLKTGLLKLSISYSSISLADVAKKLQLEAKDVEFIVAKAIKDGIINAAIDHSLGVVNFKNPDDVYNSQIPQKLIQARSTECYKLYSKFMASMTYPKSAYTFDTKAEESIENLSDLEYILRTYEEDSF